MATLTDRYVDEVLRGVPTSQRPEIERELRASIADAIEAQTPPGDHGADHPSAETQALAQLGDPAVLAASLSDRPQYLIGPGLYWDYRRTLSALLKIIPVTVALVVGTIDALSGSSLASVLWDGLGLLIVVAIQVVAWTTLGFAIAEHTGMRSLPGHKDWSVDDLPHATRDEVTLGETVGTILTVLISVALLAWQHVVGVQTADGQQVPVIDPALWQWWLAALILIMTIEAVLQVVAHARRGWGRGLVISRIVASLAFAVVGVTMLVTQPLINPVLAAEWGDPAWAQTGGTLSRAVAWGIAVVTAVDVVDAIRRSRVHRQAPVSSASSRS